MREIGFIFECGREGPDKKVCEHLVGMIDSDIKFISLGLDNKKNLISNCGKTAGILLKTCDKVIIIWDLYPSWERKKKPCLHQDRTDIFANLEANGVSKNDVELVCIKEELEAWLIADERALKEFISDKKPTHSVEKISKSKKPDSVRNPKTKLTKLFNKELGRQRKYDDYKDAEKIIKKVNDFKRLCNSESFKRFVNKLNKTECCR